MKHPLMKFAPKHYISDDKTAIEQFEEDYTAFELISWCKLTIAKYEYRKDKKGQKESDLEKIEAYKDYLEFLENVQDMLPPNHKSFKDACIEFLHIEMDYSA